MQFIPSTFKRPGNDPTPIPYQKPVGCTVAEAQKLVVDALTANGAEYPKLADKVAQAVARAVANLKHETPAQTITRLNRAFKVAMANGDVEKATKLMADMQTAFAAAKTAMAASKSPDATKAA